MPCGLLAGVEIRYAALLGQSWGSSRTAGGQGQSSMMNCPIIARLHPFSNPPEIRRNFALGGQDTGFRGLLEEQNPERAPHGRDSCNSAIA